MKYLLFFFLSLILLSSCSKNDTTQGNTAPAGMEVVENAPHILTASGTPVDSSDVEVLPYIDPVEIGDVDRP